MPKEDTVELKEGEIFPLDGLEELSNGKEEVENEQQPAN